MLLFSTRSFFHAISFSIFSISHLTSVWEWGIYLLSQPRGATDSAVFEIPLRPQGLLSFGVLNSCILTDFVSYLFWIFSNLFFLLWDGSAPTGIASCLLCYFSYSWLRYKRRHRLLATSTGISSFSPKLNANLRTMRGCIHGKLGSQFLIWVYLTSFSLFGFFYLFILFWILFIYRFWSRPYSNMLLLWFSHEARFKGGSVICDNWQNACLG